MKDEKPQTEETLTYKLAEEILANTTAIREAGKAKQEHAKASEEIQIFCANMARAMRLLLSRDKNGNFNDTRRAKVKNAFQPFFDDLYNEKLIDSKKDESRAIIAILRRALRTATDLKAYKAELWAEKFSVVCNTVGSESKKAQLVHKEHETTEQKTARIAKEDKAKEEAKAKRVFDAEITMTEAILYWNLETLALVEEALEAKFAFIDQNKEWEIENGVVVLKKQQNAS
tara:strand:+ start:360 stop:1049 length:690 start_codon:yes stop_codon:yes gene_type:complete